MVKHKKLTSMLEVILVEELIYNFLREILVTALCFGYSKICSQVLL